MKTLSGFPRNPAEEPPPVLRRALRDSLSECAPFRRPSTVQLRAAYKGSVARSPSARTRAKRHGVTELRSIRSPERLAMAGPQQQPPYLHLAELTASQFLEIWKHFDADGQ